MPELTFTENEVRDLTDFGNFVFNNAKFQCSHKEFINYNKLYTKFVEHLKKCEKHIMELKEVIPPKGKQAPKRGRKPKEGK